MPRKKHRAQEEHKPATTAKPACVFDDRTLSDDRGCLYAYRNNDEINAMGTDFRMIVGERSNGKTYPTITFDGLKRFIDSDFKESFAYVRRWAEDIKANAPELFNGPVGNGWLAWYTKGQYNRVQYYRGKWYLVQCDDKGEVKAKCKHPVAYAFALSMADHYKGADYPDIYTIIFDEFIPDGSGYIPREWRCWQSIMSTIIRRRTDVLVYMIANTVSPNCPYFDAYGIKIDEMPQGTINKYQYKGGGTLAIEYCESTDGASNKAQPSDKYFIIDDKPGGSMITRGDWELPDAPKLPRNLSHVGRTVFRFWIITSRDKVIQGNIIETGGLACVFFHDKTTPLQWRKDDYVYMSQWDADLMYCPTYRVGFDRTKSVDRTILDMVAGNRAYYSNPVVADKLKFFIDQTKKGL